MTGGRTPARRRRLAWTAGQAAGLSLVAVLTAVLAPSATTAAFTAATGDLGNQVSAAADFCTAPGRVDTLSTSTTTIVDTTVYQLYPTTNYSTETSIGVRSGSGSNGRSLIRFALLSRPAGCVVGSAVLRLRVNTTDASGTIQVYRAAGAWTAGTVTWNTAPGFTGTAATAATTAVGTVTQWDVGHLVTELYAGPDHGFLIKDASEDTGGNRHQLYDSTEAGTASYRPTLTITWG